MFKYLFISVWALIAVAVILAGLSAPSQNHGGGEKKAAITAPVDTKPAKPVKVAAAETLKAPEKPKEYYPGVGDRAILKQTAFGCADWEDYKELEDIALSGDGDAFKKFIVLRLPFRCNAISDGDSVILIDTAPLHQAVKVRKVGELQTLWIPRKYGLLPPK